MKGVFRGKREAVLPSTYRCGYKGERGFILDELESVWLWTAGVHVVGTNMSLICSFFDICTHWCDVRSHRNVWDQSRGGVAWERLVVHTLSECVLLDLRNYALADAIYKSGCQGE